LCAHHYLSSLFSYGWRGNKYTPMVHMHGIGFHQPYIAVYARPRVPTGVGLVCIVHFYGDSVGLISIIEIGSQGIAERNITIRPFAQIMAVYPHFAAMIDTIKIDKKQLGSIFFR